MTGTVSIHLRAAEKQFPFVCFDNDASKSICAQILAGKTYPRIPFLREVRSIVDVGANVGAASVYFALVYPSAQIHAFEPDAESFALLSRNARLFRNVQCHNFGLFSSNCRRTLYRGAVDSVTGSIGKSSLNTERGTEIILRDAGQAIAEAGLGSIDILKVDTEGCEIPILKSAMSLASRAKAIYVEYHSERDRRTIDNLLADSHVLFVGTASHNRGEFCYVRRSAFPSPEDLAKGEILIDGID